MSGTGSVSLQVCGACFTVQYPARELCRLCLADKLDWTELPSDGRIVSEARLHRSLEPGFNPYLPLRIGTITMSVGATVIAILAPDCVTGDAVALALVMGPLGEELFVAVKPGEHPTQFHDVMDVKGEANG